MEARKNLEVLTTEMKERVAQYKKAAKSLYNEGYYLRQRNQKHKCYSDLYVLEANGNVMLLAYECTFARCQRLIEAIRNKKLDEINPIVLENYVHNGYNTRRGLFAKYSDKQLSRMQDIAFSHAEIMEDGKWGHELRVHMRNRR